jgi:RHS repeat-associated protein
VAYPNPNGSNQIASVVISEPNLSLTANYVYDSAGNVTDDGVNKYLYDGDNRLCAVYHYVIGTMTQYLYDADGTRVGKGSITTFSCDLRSNNGFVLTNEYYPGPSGEQMTEFDVQGNWLHTNAYAGSQLIATYVNDGKGVHFYVPDWLGTRRVQADSTGTTEVSCTNNPFGDPDIICAAAAEQFFTGKERDSESLLDYFGARHYGSTMGRYMSPDWSASPTTVPYATFTDPQTLNLYMYGRNNPLSSRDFDGHNWFTNLVSDVWRNISTAVQSTPTDNTTVTSTETEHTPIPAVTGATDAAGLFSMTAPTVAKELHLGPFSAVASMINDPRMMNIGTNLFALTELGEAPMAPTTALTDFMEWSANNSTPGPQKPYDNDQLQPVVIPTQNDGACAASGAPGGDC